MEMNLAEKLTDETFFSDIEPLIAPDIDWELSSAGTFRKRCSHCFPENPGAAGSNRHFPADGAYDAAGNRTAVTDANGQ